MTNYVMYVRTLENITNNFPLDYTYICFSQLQLHFNHVVFVLISDVYTHTAQSDNFVFDDIK